MKKCRRYLFFGLGILLICALAPLSVHAADEGVSNGSKLSDWNYTVDESGKSITLVKYNGTSKDIVVPGKFDGYDGYKVKIKSFKDARIKMGDSLVVGTPENQVIFDGISLAGAFQGNGGYQSIDLSGLDTSKVTDMSNMFSQNYRLKKLDVSKLDTSNVRSMERMFYDCRNLQQIDVSNFDTSNVTNMHGMFTSCDDVEQLDVSNFDTSKVTDMGWMFYGCDVPELNVSKFDTSKVTDMEAMFGYCSGVKQLDVGHFDTSKVTDMRLMFCGNNTLEQLDVSNFDTSNVTDMAEMFSGCKKLTQLDVSKFDTSKVTRMNGMFEECNNVTQLDVNNFDTSNVTLINKMFYNCQSVKKLDLSGWDLSKLNETSRYFYLFAGCEKLQFIDLSVNSFPQDKDSVFPLYVGRDGTTLQTVIITENNNVKSYSADGKTMGSYRKRIPYTATVYVDANGGTFGAGTTYQVKVVTIGDKLFYNTVADYTEALTVTSDKLSAYAEKLKKDGKNFEGWYLDRACTKPFTSKELTLGNDKSVTVYAGYEKDKLKDSTIKINSIAKRPYDGKPTSLTADNCTITGSTGDITFTYEQKVGDTWKKIDGAPVNAGTYRVKATLAADATYKGAESDYMEFTIKKATPKYEVPKGLEAIEGQTLADVKLPQGFTWDKNATTSVGAPGNQEFTVTYTPDDTDNFEVVKDIKVTIKVHMKWIALNEIPVINAEDKTLTVGDNFDPKSGVTATDKEDGDLTDQIEIAKNTVDTSKAGLYSVTYKVTDKGGVSAEKTINVVVKEKTFPPTTVSQNGSVNSAKTSDAMPIGMLVVLMLIAAAGIVFCSRKLYKSR